MFGGQLIAQALAAASFTTPNEFRCQSLHAYFVRPGQATRPTDYEVSNMRDGRSSAIRKVMAVQRDELICELTASFGSGSSGQAPRSFQAQMPELMPPHELFQRVQDSPQRDSPDLKRRPLVHYGPLQIMPAQPMAAAPRMCSWIRVKAPLVDDPNLHACALAYSSDLGAVHASMRAVGAEVLSLKWQIASLDHAVWFHRPFRADDWLLFAFDCTSVSEDRGLNHGLVYTPSGELVASIAQEALIREREPGEP
jgi:acyl-CoA thioesterase-2